LIAPGANEETKKFLPISMKAPERTTAEVFPRYIGAVGMAPTQFCNALLE
jgi:hypothetical protein